MRRVTLCSGARSLYSPDNDPQFAQPYIDGDEWRTTPVRHRYVHGGFKGAETRFSIYFPPKDKYQGHFFQHATPSVSTQSSQMRDGVPRNSFWWLANTRHASRGSVAGGPFRSATPSEARLTPWL